MKKILIVIMDMGLGGAQKSLQTFLQCLTASELGRGYTIHLMVIKPVGELMAQIPKQVTVVEPPKELRWLGTPLKYDLIAHHFSWRSMWGEMRWLLKSRLKLFPHRLNKQQRLWECWHKLIPAHKEHYDVAISYIDGFTNYYVIDKVSAEKKILWVHNEYQKHNYDPAYDHRFYEACDGIITISEKCRQCIVEEFPKCAGKTHVLENITSYENVIEQSDTQLSPEHANVSKLRLLSVGRLHRLKGFDLAIGAAKLLRDAGVRFLWLIIGEGPDHQQLQSLINSYELEEYVQLLGAQENPYGYMKACDIMVQPSRSEGKSIVLDEAKLLCKPVIVTNYTTVNDSVEHGKSGWIVDMTEEGVFHGIMRLKEDGQLRKQITDYLRSLPKGNEKELREYVRIMLS